MEPLVWTVEGSALYGAWHAPAEPSDRAVLCLHGYNSDHRSFGDFPERLAAAGMHAVAFDQRGFGASGGEEGRIGLGRVIADAKGAMAALEDRVGHRLRWAAVGQSLGASYALGIQAREGGFEAGVAAHPIDRILDGLPSWKKGAYHVMGRVHRRRLRKGRAPRMVAYPVSYRDLYRDPEARAAAQRAGYLRRTANLANYDFAATMQARDWAAKVDCPVLAVTSRHDKLIPPQRSEGVIEALAGDVERFAHEGGHALFRDNDREAVARACLQFLERRFS